MLRAVNSTSNTNTLSMSPYPILFASSEKTQVCPYLQTPSGPVILIASRQFPISTSLQRLHLGPTYRSGTSPVWGCRTSIDVTRTELQNHTSQINAVLQETCDVRNPAPLVRLDDATIALAPSCPPALSREVTTDLGHRGIALRLPIPDARNPKFWVAIQERWQWKTRHRACFIECGLKFYAGDRSEGATQFLRLEWAAPTRDALGVLAYKGAHAGHPHWHVDLYALLGQVDYLRSLQILTAPTPGPDAEEFSELSTAQPLVDFSWLQDMHLPARAQWMQSKWDGAEIPGPHQCEPNNLGELTHWWIGALRYVSAELPH